MENPSASWKLIIWDIVKTAGVAVLLFVGFSYFVTRVAVNGPSMHPTLKDGESLLVWKTHGRIPPHGSIVVAENIDEGSRDLVKRLIGLPGDTISTVEDQVFVNGHLLDEPYAHGARSATTETWKVPSDSVFLMGDNRTASIDSRDWGFLPSDNLVGVVFFRYNPLAAFGLVR